MDSVSRWVASFRPSQGRARRSDYARAAGGAFVGILATALVGRALGWGPSELPWIVAPMGASAVLVFAVPASPLAQPWSAIGGNVLSALVAVAVVEVVSDDVLAVALAVSLAIAAMLALRCLHPPGGAVALLVSYGSVTIEQQGWAVALWPVGVNTACLVAVALAFNNLTGRRYPHVAELPPPTDSPQPDGIQLDDVEAAMAGLDAGLDVAASDVVALLRDAETHALDRQLGRRPIADVMRTDVATVLPSESAYRARLVMGQRRVRSLPVVDDERHVLGMVTMLDLFSRDLAEVVPVEQVMVAPVATVQADAPVAEAIASMVDLGHQTFPVVDGDDRLVGVVSRAELIVVLHRLLVDGAAAG